MADRARLTGNTAAGNPDDNVKLVFDLGQCQRLTDNQLEGLKAEIIVDVTVVDGDLAGSGLHTDAGKRTFAAARAV